MNALLAFACHALPLATGLSANRDQSCPTNIQKAAYQSVKDLAAPIQGISAAVSLRTGGQVCSGAFVSNDGHILTASHCLDSCRFKRGDPTGADTCQVDVNGVSMKVKVLAAAGCTFDVMYRSRLDLAKDPTPALPYSSKNCLGQRDMAVILPIKKPENFSCLQLDNEKSQVGSSVYSLTRPIKSWRGQQDSDGMSLQYSSGKLIPHGSSCEIGAISPHAQKRGLKKGMSFELVDESINSTHGMYQVTVDGLPGGSGGPLVSEKTGKLIGVQSQIAVSLKGFGQFAPFQVECRGNAFFEPTVALAPPNHKITNHARVNTAEMDRVLKGLKCDPVSK